MTSYRSPITSHESPVTNHQSPGTPNESQATNHASCFFDLIVSNPPYVGRRKADTLPREVSGHEPGAALYGGEEGYEFYACLVAQAAAKLKPGGVFVLELGHNSLPAVQPLFDGAAWTRIGVTNDLAGIPRVLSAERTGEQL